MRNKGVFIYGKGGYFVYSFNPFFSRIRILLSGYNESGLDGRRCLFLLAAGT